MKNQTANKKGSTLLVIALAFIGIIGLVSWGPARRTYSNRFITFTYPDTFKITDEEDGGDEYDLCCEVKGDDLAIINFSMSESDDFLELDQDDRDLALKFGVMAMKEEIESNEYYSNIKCSNIKKVKKGSYTGFSFTFTAKLLITNIQGECFMTNKGATLVATVAQAETTNYMIQLNDIISTLTIK